MADIPVSADRFGYAFDSMVAGIEHALADTAIEPSVRKACRVARKETVAACRENWSDEYKNGFTYKVRGKGMDVQGDVGNKTKPGLVHLLEKGHAKVGGGKTRAFEHLADGYERGAKLFEEELEARVGRALNS